VLPDYHTTISSTSLYKISTLKWIV